MSSKLHLLPKEETQASEFLRIYPEYDGTNVKVAIFDTGVDPGASGLTTTTSGQPKIIDLIDATGSGDVEMKIVECTSETSSSVVGLSGRTIHLNPSWSVDRTKPIRVGIKPAYELFPKKLVTRLKQERKETWLARHREAQTQVRAQVMQWKQDCGLLENSTSTTTTSLAQRQRYQDLVAQLAVLEKIEEKDSSDDVGPVYDCLVYHDGTQYRAVVDSTETGDLSQAPVGMADFKLEREYRAFHGTSLMNFGIKIYDEGAILSIVCDAGPHGTHVAGIVSAYFPETPESNGLAPGAQLVSVKIGDSRLGSMETGTGLTRGLVAVLEHQCDIINMSYGEFSSMANVGRFTDLAKEIVEEHQIVFVGSAGNSGPALNTTGAPGGSSSCILSVGAYVSPAMMQAEYSMRELVPEIAYTWSSRGPAFDGDLGVNVCAPGGAITSVPQWTLQKTQLMNGTSMSSPNVAGNVALILSGCKALNLPNHPYSIRRALENTAKRVANVETLAQGQGLIQTLAAFRYIQAFAGEDGDVTSHPLKLSVTCGSKSARGIYLRQWENTQQDSELSCTVEPVFHKHLATPGAKVQLDLMIRLESSAPSLVQTPASLSLMNSARSFLVLVKSSNVRPGTIQVEEIRGYDSTSSRDRGPIFRIPVIVMKPEIVPRCALSVPRQVFAPGQILRRLIHVPVGSEWVSVTCSRTTTTADNNQNLQDTRLYLLHLLQALPETSQTHSSLRKSFRLAASEHQAGFNMAVVPGVTLELTLAQFWSSLGHSTVSLEVEFRGVHPTLVHHHGSSSPCGLMGYQQIRLESSLRSHTVVLPKGTWNKVQQSFRPKSAQITPLPTGARDQLTQNRQLYQLLLTYAFVQPKDASTQVTPRLPRLNDVLYESPFESQLIQILDEHHQVLGTSDAFPSSISIEPNTSCTVRVQIRHDQVSKLELLKQQVLVIERPLVKSVAMTFVRSKTDAIIGNGGGAVKAFTLAKGVPDVVYVLEPKYDQLPKSIQDDPNQVALVGSYAIRKPNAQEHGASTKPDGFPLRYVVPAACTKFKDETEEATKVKTKVKTEREKLDTSVREFYESKLQALQGQESFLDVWTHVTTTMYPDSLPLRLSKLHHWKPKEYRDVIAAADDVLACVAKMNANSSTKNDADTPNEGSLQGLTNYFGQQVLETDVEGLEVQKEKKAQKQAVIEALGKKTYALGELDSNERSTGQEEDVLASSSLYKASYEELQSWIDVSKELKTTGMLKLQHETKQGHFGLALETLQKILELEDDKPKSMIFGKKKKDLLQHQYQHLLQQLKWDHIAQRAEQALLVKYPADVPLF